MPYGQNSIPIAPRRAPWNKEQLTGAKPPLQPKHVWLIRTRLQVERRTRDLAMFNLAIDSKLHGCYLVPPKAADIAPKGYTIERASIRQQKTGQPVRFELTPQRCCVAFSLFKNLPHMQLVSSSCHASLSEVSDITFDKACSMQAAKPRRR